MHIYNFQWIIPYVHVVVFVCMRGLTEWKGMKESVTQCEMESTAANRNFIVLSMVHISI